MMTVRAIFHSAIRVTHARSADSEACIRVLGACTLHTSIPVANRESEKTSYFSFSGVDDDELWD